MRFLAPTVITTERASSQLVCPFFPSFSRQSSDRQTENVLAERKERKKTKLVVDQSLKVSRDKIQANQSVAQLAHVLNCDNFHQISGIIIENQPKRRLQYLCHFVVVVVVKIFVVVIVLVIAVVTVYCAILTAAATASSPS